jgi:SOS-response transcriptional repressor LexA
MTIISEKLTKLMSSEGITAAELSRKTEIDRTVLHRILNGQTKNPSIESMQSIAKHFSVNVEEITSDNEGRWQKGEIPIISWGESTILPIKSILDNKHKFVKTNKSLSETSFALIVEHSVDNMLPKGALLIVNPEVSPKHRAFVIVQEEKEEISSIKYFILDGSTAYLKPIDPDLPTVKYSKENFRIIGVVVQSIFDFE